jgi:hypothetical protein
MDGESNTLATCGLEEPFFQLCCCVSFLFWREIGFGFTHYLCTKSTIQLWCCVSFFGSGGKLFLVLLKYLVYNTVVRLCQFFCCGRKAKLVRIFLLNPNFLLIHRNKLCCYCVSLSCFVWIYNHTVTIISQKYRELCLIS